MKNLFAPTRAVMLLACACLATTVALADEPASITVKYTKADLQGPRVVKLYNRIHTAARDLCMHLDSWQLAAHRRYEQCLDQAVTRAVAQIHSKALTAIHLARNGGTVPPQM